MHVSLLSVVSVRLLSRVSRALAQWWLVKVPSSTVGMQDILHVLSGSLTDELLAVHLILNIMGPARLFVSLRLILLLVALFVLGLIYPQSTRSNIR